VFRINYSLTVNSKVYYNENTNRLQIVLQKEGYIVEYLGTKAIAERWECSQAQVSKWCREGKIIGAEQDKKGSPWRIPSDAVKPRK